MTTRSSSSESDGVRKLTLDEIRQAWENENANITWPTKHDKPVAADNRGWQIVRLFISATFKDFQNERQVLQEKILPELKEFCETKKLTLIVCDLRQGITADVEDENLLLSSLEELDRCYEDNGFPFFLNMTGSRVGWVPNREAVPESVRQKYKWTVGFSVAEMEIMHGAYRVNNPNALFMLRSEIPEVPEETKAVFLEDQLSPLIAQRKLETLKQNLVNKFERNSQLHTYFCEYDKRSKDYEPNLKGLQDFENKVKDFFIRRISTWYPDVSASECCEDPLERIKAQQKAFMISKANDFNCRGCKVRDIVASLCSKSTSLGPKPYVVTGPPGIGKTILLAKLARELIDAKKGRVFYHFIGQTVGSNNLLILLHRMMLEIGIVKDKFALPQNVTTAIALFNQAVARKEQTQSDSDYLFIIVDALDQLDEDEEALDWLPREMTANTRWLLSFAESNPHHSYIGNCGTFDTLHDFPADDKKSFIEHHLKRYNREFNQTQLKAFLDRSKASYPLWSYLALEKLCLEKTGFEDINKKLANLDLSLTGLFDSLLASYEERSDLQWLAAIVCLLCYSHYGLLESELLYLMETVSKEKFPQLYQFLIEIGKKQSEPPRPWSYNLWAEIYKALKPFIRPCYSGGPGEGLLCLHHQQLIEAAKYRYIKRSPRLETNIIETLFALFKQSRRLDRVQDMAAVFLRTNHHRYALELSDALVPLLVSQQQEEVANLQQAKNIFLSATIMDHYLAKMATNDHDQLATAIENCCGLFRTAVDIFTTSPLVDNKQDGRIGRCYERLYFHYNDCIKRRLMPTNDAVVEETKEAVDFYGKKMFEFCEQLEEPARQITLADCWVTRGVCEKNLLYLKRGLELAETHHLRATCIRALRCIAGYHDDEGHNEEAYYYYLRWYDLLVETFGPTHLRTSPALFILDGEKYRHFAH